MNKEFKEALDASPIIASVKDFNGLEKCLTCDCKIVFILFGDICNIVTIVDKIKSAGKIAMVHLDLIAGLTSKEIAVDFIKKYTCADGIISTKPTLIKYASRLSLYTVLRFFVIDSLAYSNIAKQLQNIKPDVIEILPALMPRIVTRLCHTLPIPVIAGGLISDKEDVITMLSAGAVCISATNEDVWFL
ncbi:MAG: glycerol-3-phosphate responsive antiterminator [Lachnospiraceae bacterium]